MTEISVNAISAIRANDSSGTLARAPAQTETPAPSPFKLLAPTPAQEKTPVTSDKNPVAEKPAKPVESAPTGVVGNASNVSLQFRVDDKTKEVTVFVVDRKSKKVLRSIPASELAKLQAGDLLKMTA
jgi:hypothetical protein